MDCRTSIGTADVSPIRAVFGQDIAAYAHVKRPDSAYKEDFVFLDANIC